MDSDCRRQSEQQTDSTIVHELILIFTDLFIAEGAVTPQSVPALPALSAL